MNGKTNASDITINQVVNGVLIPLESATDFQIGSGSGRAYFTWTDPVDKYTNPGDELVSEWGKSVVVRKKDSAPSNIDDGTVVLTETVRNQYQTNQYIDETVDDDTTYYYSVYPVTTTDLVSDSTGGVAVIPMGGEPSYLTAIENPFNDSIVRYNLSVSSTTDYAIFLGGNDDGYDQGFYNGFAFNGDLTKTQLPNVENYLFCFGVGKINGNALFFQAFDLRGSTYSSTSTSYIYTNDLTRQTITEIPRDTNNRGHAARSLSINNDQLCLIFGDNSAYPLSVISTDFTVSSSNPFESTVWYDRVAGAIAGAYAIFSRPNSYAGSVDVHAKLTFAFDMDITMQQIECEPEYGTQAHGSVGATVDEFATFTYIGNLNNSVSASDLFVETYDSKLTHMYYPNTPYTDTIAMQPINNPYETARSITYQQYGNYAISLWYTYMSSTAGMGILTYWHMLNSNMTLTLKQTTDFIMHSDELFTSLNLSNFDLAMLDRYMFIYGSGIQINNTPCMLVFTI